MAGAKGSTRKYERGLVQSRGSQLVNKLSIIEDSTVARSADPENSFKS